MGGFNTYPALDIKQPEGPLDLAGKAMQLKALQGQIAAQPGQLQLQQQQIEMQKRMLDDKAAETAAMKEWAEGQGKISMDALPDLITKNGGSADARFAMQQKLIAQQQAVQQLTKEKRDNLTASTTAVANAAADVLSLPAELQPQAYAQKQKELLNAGHIDAQHAQMPFDPDNLKILSAGSQHLKDQLEMEDKRQTAAAAALTAKAREAQANKPTEASLAMASAQGDKDAEAALKRLDLSKQQSKPPVDTTSRDNARSDKSYQFSSGQLDKVGTPIEQAIQRFGRLKDTLNQNTPQADALVAPELLTVMAGGAGSGLRMNEAEISRIVGGRSNLESLKAALNKWQIDPSKALSITDAQRGQIRSLMDEVHGKLLQKQSVLDQARQDLVNEDDPFKHRMIVSKARQELTKIDMGQGAQQKKNEQADPLGIR
jgi:hypothetical protein